VRGRFTACTPNAPARLTQGEADTLKQKVAKHELQLGELYEASRSGPLAGLSITGYVDPSYVYNRNAGTSSFLFLSGGDPYTYDASSVGDLYIKFKKTFGEGTYAPNIDITIKPYRGYGAFTTNSGGSTFGNIFASHVKFGECSAQIVKSGIEYMAGFYDDYKRLSKGAGIGFFQIGGGIAGDFPICVVPSIKYDLQEPVRPWAYFCQISDSTTSYGSYSGATPNEKITWDKLTEKTPMFVVESDATIVAPMMLTALLEAKANPKKADAIIKASRAETKKSLAKR
jgi:hypothetical protein